MAQDPLEELLSKESQSISAAHEGGGRERAEERALGEGAIHDHRARRARAARGRMRRSDSRSPRE